MESPFFGELLILYLLLLNCCRMFFLRYGKVDSLTILAPITVILAVLQIFAWGVSTVSVVILFISLFCFFTNFRALLRFAGGLYVDHYNFGFKVGAFLVIILSLLVTGFLFKYRPVILNKKSFDVVQKKVRVSGDFTGGLRKSELFEKADGEILIIEPEKNWNCQSIVVIADKRADSIEYIPLMKFLAVKGYRVYGGDFFTRDSKWLGKAGNFKSVRKFLMKTAYFDNPTKFEAEKEFYSFNCQKELKEMLDFVEREEAVESENGLQFEPVFVIGDWMSDICLEDVAKNDSRISGYLKLSEVKEYETCGFGFVQQTEPFTAHLLGKERDERLVALNAVTVSVLEKIPAPVYEHKIEESEEIESAEESVSESVEEKNDAE